ncbi:MAG: hypothetical protein ACTSUR_06190 [Candidatus Heimdallarchaeaceae archaeon]
MQFTDSKHTEFENKHKVDSNEDSFQSLPQIDDQSSFSFLCSYIPFCLGFIIGDSPSPDWKKIFTVSKGSNNMRKRQLKEDSGVYRPFLFR